MPSDTIHLSDWKRLLIGNEPWRFLPEVVLRVVVLYVSLLVALRLLGKRLSGQLTILELALMITLGAIVSAPMVMSSKGVLVGIVLLLTALVLQRGLGRAGLASDRFEILLHGDATLLIKDGVLQIEALDRALLSRFAVFATLRTKGVFHLGEVKRLYLEPAGGFTLLRESKARPGLALLGPETDAGRYRGIASLQACGVCGVVQSDDARPCPQCGTNQWRTPVKAVDP